ncbi:PulG Type II secretory pathway, pseudopilin PulG [uncultured Caudovirales phage]|uniref:PulG Type II secretory pathway, pseudopilin PulG n=1 Tax=uncultured Caudovirales phage TaxID=2100421 RepID=A0A6J5L4N3_9CAUD|nr:PulG Type II secretory pathway, pseudopilin PulG [uncultured Caudovirales phage]
MNKQKGFTLVEIAIVLVIIGLLLGGVLKGQEMIDNARIKNIVNDFKAIQTANNAYLDRYKAMPGDEPAATMTGRGWAGTAVPAVAGNGVWAITLAQTFTNGGDQPAVWRALRASGLMTGDAAAPATVAGLMAHGGAGLFGLTAGPAYGMGGPLVCISGLTTKQVAAMDLMIDGAGAANNTGSFRAATGAANPLIPVAAAPAATTYDESLATRWTACIPL